jgi:hypothetical protein
MNPRMKRNFLGDAPSSERRMVHEKVGSSSPRRPQAPNKGGIIMEKLKLQAKRIIRKM